MKQPSYYNGFVRYERKADICNVHAQWRFCLNSHVLVNRDQVTSIQSGPTIRLGIVHLAKFVVNYHQETWSV